MKDLNIAILKGRLTHDAGKNTGKDVSFFNFSVATNTGTGSERPATYHRINYPSSSEKEIEFLTRHLVKGCPVFIEGEARVYEKDGSKIHYVRAHSVEVLSFVEEPASKAPADIDSEEAALGFDEPPRRVDPPAPRTPKPREMPAVAPRARVQATSMTESLVPAAGGEVIF